jgi:ArsR family transcriptional regulator
MNITILDNKQDGTELAKMMFNARRATEFLKALGHEGRLMILCHLAAKERSVSELEELLSQRQLERLVVSRREGKTIYYSLADGRARQMVEIIYDMFSANMNTRN